MTLALVLSSATLTLYHVDEHVEVVLEELELQKWNLSIRATIDEAVPRQVVKGIIAKSWILLEMISSGLDVLVNLAKG